MPLRQCFACVLAMTLAVGLSSCGPKSNPGSGTEEHRHNGEDQTPKPSVNSNVIYGVWSGKGTSSDGTHSFVQRFHFKNELLQVSKTCHFANGKLTVLAEAPIAERKKNTAVELTGVITTWLTKDGNTCEIDFPLGLVFKLEEGRILVRLMSSEKATGLEKISD